LAPEKVGGLPCGWLITDVNGQPRKEPPHPPLAQDKVRYVGDHVAVVIAETYWQAKDAAERLDIEYEPLPAVVDAVEALRPGAPARSEEHTSELQSRENLVCRLLLEKKNTKATQHAM